MCDLSNNSTTYSDFDWIHNNVFQVVALHFLTTFFIMMSSSNQSLPSTREHDFQYDNTSSMTNSILPSYSSYNELKDSYNIYQLTKDQQHKKVYNDFQIYKYHKQIMNKYEEKFNYLNPAPPQDNTNFHQDNLALVCLFHQIE